MKVSFIIVHLKPPTSYQVQETRSAYLLVMKCCHWALKRAGDLNDPLIHAFYGLQVTLPLGIPLKCVFYMKRHDPNTAG